MNQSIGAFIADDEYQSRLVILNLLHHYFAELPVLGQAGTVTEAIEGICRLRPRVLFLDIQMNGETGFDVLDRLPDTNFEVIFTTAYPEYAARAFRYSAIDYLVKPIDPSELQSATSKALRKIDGQQSVTSEQLKILHQRMNPGRKFTDKIAIPTSEGLIFVSVREIIYCQGQSNYTDIFLLNGQKIVSSHTLKTYEDMLTGQHFFRAHKSFLINLQHIEIYRRGQGGNVVMSDGREIEIARRNKSGFLNLFNR